MIAQLDGASPEFRNGARIRGGDLLPDQALELIRLLGRGEDGERSEEEGQRKEASQHGARVYANRRADFASVDEMIEKLQPKGSYHLFRPAVFRGFFSGHKCVALPRKAST